MRHDVCGADGAPLVDGAHVSVVRADSRGGAKAWMLGLVGTVEDLDHGGRVLVRFPGSSAARTVTARLLRLVD